KEFTGRTANTHVFLTISYSEQFRDEDRQGEGPKAFTRVTEVAAIETHHHRPAGDGSLITLARVLFDQDSHIHEVDTSVQRRASALIGARSVGAEELQDFAVTEQKLAEELRSRIGRVHGWVRMPFKPSPIERVRIENPEAEIHDGQIEFDTPFIGAIGYV